MNRRAFFRTLAAAAIAAPAVADELIWRPGAKLISIPRPRLVVPRMYVRYLNIQTEVQRDQWAETLPGCRIGDTVQIPIREPFEPIGFWQGVDFRQPPSFGR